MIFFVNYISIGINRDLSLISNFACKLMPYLVRVTVQIPSWIQVLITLDRLIYIRYFNRFAFMQNKKILAFIITAMVSVLLLVNFESLLYNIIDTTQQSSNATTNTTPIYSCTSDKPIIVARDMTAVISRTIIPFILIVLLNSLLVRSVTESKAKFKNNSDVFRKEFSFIISIIFQGVFFILMLAPLAVSLVLFDIYL